MKCHFKATHRFTWPGQKESFICRRHIYKLREVAKALDLNLEIIPIHESEFEGETCRQQVERRFLESL